MSAIPPNLPPHLADDYLFGRNVTVYDGTVVRFIWDKQAKARDNPPTAEKIPDSTPNQ